MYSELMVPHKCQHSSKDRTHHTDTTLLLEVCVCVAWLWCGRSVFALSVGVMCLVFGRRLALVGVVGHHSHYTPGYSTYFSEAADDRLTDFSRHELDVPSVGVVRLQQCRLRQFVRRSCTINQHQSLTDRYRRRLYMSHQRRVACRSYMNE